MVPISSMLVILILLYKGWQVRLLYYFRARPEYGYHNH